MSRYYPPNRRRHERAIEREKAVARLALEGVETTAIALRLGITTRQVQRLRRRQVAA